MRSRRCTSLWPGPRAALSDGRRTDTSPACATRADRQAACESTGTNDFGDHVTCPTHDDCVSRPQILAMQLALVVQRGIGDGDAANEHRLENRVRGDGPGAPNVDPDLLEGRSSSLQGAACRRRPSAGSWRYSPRSPCSARSSTLTTTPSIS